MAMVLQQQQEEHDARLLRLLREDRVPIAAVLHWLHAHHGPGPPSVDQGQLFPPGDQQWWEELGTTTPQSFAVSFLNCVRAEVQPLIAVADSVGDVVAVKPSLAPAEAEQSKEPETKVEAPKTATENASAYSGSSKGGKDRRKSTGTILQAIQEPKRLQLPVYDDDFPALGNVNVKKTATQSKQKRRVNPTPMVNPVVDSAFILAKVEAPMTTQQSNVNKSKLSGAGPVKVDMDVLMQRCEISRKQKQREKPEAPKKENIKNWSWEKFDSRPTSQVPPSDVVPKAGGKFSGGFNEEGDAFPAITQIMVLRGNGGDLSPGATSPWSITKGSQVETGVEHIITTTIHQLLGPAMDYAKGHAADRTAEALAALADPEESAFVLSVAAGMRKITAVRANSNFFREELRKMGCEVISEGCQLQYNPPLRLTAQELARLAEKERLL